MKTMSNTDQNDNPDLFLPKEQKPAIDLKGSVFTLTVLRLQSNDLADVERELEERLALGPRFFEDAPIVVDVEILKDQALEVDFPALVEVLRKLRLVPVGLRHGSHDHQKAALGAGFALMKGGVIKDLPSVTQPAPKAEKPAKPKKPPPPPPTAETAESTDVKAKATKVIYQPIRSGQQIYARGGDLIVMAAVNAGAEIVADGNIHIYAPLRGRALAGVTGDTKARIFCQHMDAELVAIAGHYRVFEDQVPPEYQSKAVQFYLDDEQLNISLLA